MIRSRSELWRDSLRVWLPALIFFLIAAAALGVYRLRFASEAEVSERSVERTRRALSALTHDRDQLATDIERIRANRAMLESFYGDRLATESERLTRIIAEVKDLAQRSGLEPLAIRYPEEAIEGFGLRRRAFEFGVKGTYNDLRELINLLELSDSFLTLEQVTLVESGGGGPLGIELRLSTLFATEDAPLLEAARAGRRGDGTAAGAASEDEAPGDQETVGGTEAAAGAETGAGAGDGTAEVRE